jgi:hypothetical protein
MTARRTALGLLAVLLVVQPIAAPAMAAGVADTEEECEAEENLGAESFASLLGLKDSGLCKVEKVQAIAEQERRNELWRHRMDGLEDSEYLNDNLYPNYIHDSRQVADGIVKAEVADQFANGVSKSVAYERAMNANEEYYSRMQYNFIQRWEKYVAQLHSDVEIAANDTRLDHKHIYYAPSSHDSNEFSASHSAWLQPWTTTKNITLANGTAVPVEMPVIGWQASSDYWSMTPGSGNLTINPFDDSNGRHQVSEDYSGNGYFVYVKEYVNMRWEKTDGPTEQRQVVDTRDWVATWDKLENAEMLQSNVFNESFEPIWLNLQEGNINASDLYGPYQMLDRVSDGDGNVSPQVLALLGLSNLGIGGADLNVSNHQVVRIKGFTGVPPLAEKRVTASNNSGTPTQLSFSHDLTRENNSVLHVRLWYDDGTYQTVPRSEWSVMRTDSSSLSVTAWEGESVSGKNVSNITATVLVGHDPNETVYVNRTVEGVLYTGAAKDGTTLSVGEWYQTGQQAGVQGVATLNGTVLNFEGRYSIVEAYDREGNAVENVTFTGHTYATYNSSDYQQMLDRYTALQKDLNEQEENLAGGGSGGGGTGGSGEIAFPDLGPDARTAIVAAIGLLGVSIVVSFIGAVKP